MNVRTKYLSHRYRSADGIEFASRLEGRRYEQLLLLARAGQIADLERQVPFALHAPLPDGGKGYVGKYVADFVYTRCRDGKRVVEETKGYWTPLAKWKWKHAKHEYAGEYEFIAVYKEER